ncbi:pentapeptide repeat-containing protein [Streptomyces sp. 5-8]|uniref:Pentapeptide repeat-containing protein n=1 Tax=Streptomyces musisoli TaxID=2802280 RepID=A0ABS1PBZ9_9ACTN|nr:pentapeptide repeat-containing protein [Streptomyces musisoli]MBL1109725.1 pentapeptide repeat-containing protein [Streptomyces musisoli]
MGSVRFGRIAAYGLATVSGVLLVVAVLSWGRLVDLATRIPLVPLVLVIASAACALAAGELYRRTRPRGRRRFAPPIRWWWVLLASAAVLAAVWVTTALLLAQAAHMPSANERTKERIEAVRTGLAAGAGAGAALTVLLAFRRQLHHERATEESEHDADERRITELYTKAVEQLGSPQAPVRLGGLYALERLGQAAADHRQTIVDVICAYLRMPYTPPAISRHSKGERKGWRQKVTRSRQAIRARVQGKMDNQRRQELQVRKTAERILTAHLCDSRLTDQRETTTANDRFWEGMRIELSHATLTTGSFNRFHVAEANFSDATFTGDASFIGATFTGHALFSGATFTRDAGFSDASFTDHAWFRGATFAGDAWFVGATFTRDAWFSDAMFTGHAWFGDATFTGDAGFRGATFTGDAQFGDATFTGHAWFRGARARLTTSEGTPLACSWPPGWDVQPTTDGWGIFRRPEASWLPDQAPRSFP